MVVVVKDQLLHFSHHHPLNLLHLQSPKQREEEEDDDDNDNDEDDFVEEDHHGGQCNLCNEQIWSFHSCYYHCKSCDYSLHKFCAELPEFMQDHPLHVGHTLTLSMSYPYQMIHYRNTDSKWKCYVCNLEWKDTYNYHCSLCNLSRGKTSKNFKEDEHPNLLHCPFQNEGVNLLKHYMFDQKKFISSQHDGEMLNHLSHQHPLILIDKKTSVGEKLVSLHDPMKRVQLLCDGCVRPIMTVPFYICFHCADKQCCFVLHEWCAKLPMKIEEYDGHPQHTLFLLPEIPGEFFGVFDCAICFFPSNGFAYGCTTCKYYVDINCAFIPKEITHDSHIDHIRSKVNPSAEPRRRYCKACKYSMKRKFGFHCRSCDFYIHVQCALFLPKIITHKCDKHPLSLRYEPVENQLGEYFCEVCENKFDPFQWFYHCTTCLQSMHAACAPLILQNELATYDSYDRCIYKFLNIKFGGSLKINNHSHRLVFAQGLQSDDDCNICLSSLQYKMAFKCLECHDFACHYECVSSVVDL
ncbi:hypothetical protein E3N88_38463 [Mikania micrantha]|uniref:Phorbol-ester/DAG-type domain-containing protein n=1 Tax=Mikania micrantha TaxID=192012 RepID=A0A5N6LU26_9ASTR|nr:hypothetical protein E3N88_38463 [Mikania micrantha]